MSTLLLVLTPSSPTPAEQVRVEASEELPEGVEIHASWAIPHRRSRSHRSAPEGRSWPMAELFPVACETGCKAGKYAVAAVKGDEVLSTVWFEVHVPSEPAAADELTLAVERLSARRVAVTLTNGSERGIWVPNDELLGVSCFYITGNLGGGSLPGGPSRSLTEDQGTVLEPGESRSFERDCEVGKKKAQVRVKVGPVGGYFPTLPSAPAVHMGGEAVWEGTFGR